MRSSGGRRRREAEGGSVAILVLWGLALIFVLVSAASMTVRTETRIAGNSIAAARARYAAEAGTQLGLSRLLRRAQAGATGFDGTPQEWRDGATRVSVAIVDEAGKIDVNQAPLELLAGLFAAVGRSKEEAVLLACNILDRRGTAAPSCPEPAEGDPAVRRRGHRFAAPEELTQVPGVDEATYAAVADFITVATGASAVDPLSAPRAVLLAIPGATPELVDTYLSNRETWRDMAGAGDVSGLLPAAPFLTASPGRDFTIESVATTSEGARFRADLQLRLTGTPTHPYEVIAWRSPPIEAGEGRTPQRASP
ncbi:MAG: general secretion pathway protein GspK [Alphaproteobacteria bacterium]|nr:general secretion pathway protein GspK [Alphaproteobacteria bacterium]